MASFKLTVQPLEPRSTDPVYCTVLPASTKNLNSFTFVIENGLDKNVACQLQGKAKDGATWIDIGSPATVNSPSGSIPTGGTLSLAANWGLLRVKLTPADIPTAGAVNVYVEAGFSGAVV
jgi:hypothetical protein